MCPRFRLLSSKSAGQVFASRRDRVTMHKPSRRGSPQEIAPVGITTPSNAAVLRLARLVADGRGGCNIITEHACGFGPKWPAARVFAKTAQCVVA